MRKRIPSALTRVNAVTVTVVPVTSAVRLVTLNDPAGSHEDARGAFARIQPPADHPASETRSWRDVVAKTALAVRVSPTPRSALVATDAARGGDPVETVREAALAIAEEAGDPPLVELVEKCLSEVEK